MAATSATIRWSPQPLLPTISLDFSLPLAAANCQGCIVISDPDLGLRFAVAAMFTASKKISKDKGVEPTEFEDSVAQVRFCIPTSTYLTVHGSDSSFHASVVRPGEQQQRPQDQAQGPLHKLCSIRQVDLSRNKEAVMVHVPYRPRNVYRKIHVRLVRELENRKILPCRNCSIWRSNIDLKDLYIDSATQVDLSGNIDLKDLYIKARALALQL